MDKKTKELWDKYEDEFLDWLDKTIHSFKLKVLYLKKIQKEVLENKCEVKGCIRRGTHIIITHGDEDHRICEQCVDKYFRGSSDESVE